MKRSTIFVLAAVTTIVIVTILLLSTPQKTEVFQSAHRVFPELMSAINDVAEIDIVTQTGPITIIRNGNQWNIKEKFGYSADKGKVRQTLIGLAELRLYEPKTKNPELYKKLGLLDVEAEGSTSTSIHLKTADGTSLAELLIGKQRAAKGNPNQDEIYIRKPQDPQTWLTIGKLNIIQSADKWLDTAILNVDENRIRRVRILHPDETSLTIEKDTPSATDFQVLDLPKDATISSPFNVNNIASTLANLSFDEVHHKAEVDLSTSSHVTAIVETFDGLQVTIKTALQDGQQYITGSAIFQPDLRQEIEPPQKEIEKKEDESEKTRRSKIERTCQVFQ